MELKGMGVSPGTIKGKVRVIMPDQETPVFKEDDILVTTITDPTMVFLMNKAGGIICEIGGMTSHPSIVSRELGIPCVVSVTDATKTLKDGDVITMDGKTGIIKVE